MLISIIVVTKDRPQALLACLQSIKKMKGIPFELIVVDQSDDSSSTHIARKFMHNTYILFKYKKTQEIGLSKGHNEAIYKTSGDILAFTDDDCIVSENWLSTIQQSFERYPKISALFGNTLAHEPNLHLHEACPSTFTNKKQTVITHPCIHYKHIGFGNNMAIRRSALVSIGGFKEWLGPGSIGSNAEDAEIALRLLVKGHTILCNPKAIVYHNKWLTHEEMQKQNLSYICGEMACYGYFHFQGHQFASQVVRDNIRDSYNETKHISKRIFLFQWGKQLLQDICYAWRKIEQRGRGLLVGYIFSLTDPIR